MRALVIVLALLIVQTLAFEYRSPSIHPFKTTADLLNEAKKDPFGFDVSKFKYSIETMNTLRKNPNQDEKNFKPDVETVHLKFSEQLENGIEQVHQIDASVYTGVVNVKDYQADIKKITVATNGKSISVEMKNRERIAKDWIPGARIIIENNEQPKFYLVIRRSRSIFTPSTLKLEVEELEFWDLFEDAEATVQRFNSNKNLRFNVLAFNWDPKEKQCRQRNLPIYKDNIFSLTCAECYSYVDAEIEVKFRVNWRRGITYFKNVNSGHTKLHYDILASSSHEFVKRIEKELYKTKGFTIRFSIGPVPVWIDFHFFLRFKSNLSFRHDTTLSFKGEFTNKLSLGFEYDAGRQDKFKTIKSYQQSDLKDLIPKPQFRSNIEVKGDLSLIPELQIHFFSAAGLRLGLVPTLDASLKGEFGNKVQTCPRNQIEYETGFGMNAYAQMLKLKFWKFEASLGGLLPYPKDPVSEYTLVERKVLKKGCFKF